jgi:hypothetical protein
MGTFLCVKIWSEGSFWSCLNSETESGASSFYWCEMRRPIPLMYRVSPAQLNVHHSEPIAQLRMYLVAVRVTFVHLLCFVNMDFKAATRQPSHTSNSPSAPS